MKMIPISQPQIDKREIKAVTAVLKSGRLAQGPKIREFEEQFAKTVGARHAVAVCNGTTALKLALLAHGIGQSDEVITTPFSFISTASAILEVGARPVFVDVEEETGNIDPESVANAGNGRLRIEGTKTAVLPVHLYGHPSFALEYAYATGTPEHVRSVPIICDACQAHGSALLLNDKMYPLGFYGTSCWSFYATKNITTGEGGMVTTNNEDIAEQLRLLRNHGTQKEHGDSDYYYHTCLGYNAWMTEMQAAIGLVQLDKLPEMQAIRQNNADYLTHNLEGVITPVVRPGCVHAWHQYTVRIPGGRERRDDLRAHLQKRGIQANVYYPLPLHLQPVFAHLGYKFGDFPVAEKLSGEVLSLPVHPGLSQDDLGRIVEAVNEWD